MSWWVMAFFLVVGLVGMPLAFALGAAAIGGLWLSNVDFNMLPQRMMAAVNSFPLMAIPLFMVAGELMIRGGIMEQMVAFSNALVGRVRAVLVRPPAARDLARFALARHADRVPRRHHRRHLHRHRGRRDRRSARAADRLFRHEEAQAFRSSGDPVPLGAHVRGGGRAHRL